jgi:hypothetical protein
LIKAFRDPAALMPGPGEDPTTSHISVLRNAITRPRTISASAHFRIADFGYGERGGFTYSL